jgi:hypothetical protein
MQVIRLGSSGNDVRDWQLFLTGQGFYQGVVNGKFDEVTKTASIAFQNSEGLQPDGIVGNKTIGAAMILGFNVLADDTKGKGGPNWPPKPSFAPLVNNSARQKVFGAFEFKAKPLPGNIENIEILGSWRKDNIISVDIPQLKKIKGSSGVEFHKLAAAQLKKMWADWEKAGLMHLVLVWSGSFVPRFIRGSDKILSNHSFGSAFDINVEWNGLKMIPALVGQKGSVRELVPIANENGFYWGGHFERLDGMHFEIAKIL